ncbi:RpiB/LacA/LacB family sugar-phosphate isomerase [Micromonospora radicis]|uniref:RpiB/LacA/LacB family sugar-phosphate isomerase n=1 Tax=Micromonospora radicis TaxID=1894971 RepID=A0A418MPZ2_9ACTN|nr:RpiB/LacA/LacB family sugar-phosphate isomerase [Micromonospora radicis]RIV34575.1 RpiB/LacA/LacB family sugar-phosphate isomerase [Micromonospora radicis]
MIVGFGSDPNAGELKNTLMAYAEALGHEARDLGSDDPLYPRTAVDVAKAVVAGEVDRGVVLCGTGIGVSIAANKVRGAHCALVTDTYQAQRAQLSNNANLIAMGSQVTGPELAKLLLAEYLGTAYVENDRSAPKLAELERLENA